ncbi:MAG: REP-associated tyrosine transposase [Chloroflexota bacterium]
MNPGSVYGSTARNKATARAANSPPGSARGLPIRTDNIAAVPGSAGGPPAKTDDTAAWRSRGYIPHFDYSGLVQMITYRLADALPKNKLAEFCEDLSKPMDAKARQRIEEYIDAGYGSCYLRDPRIAQTIETNLLHFDGIRYHLITWVVMPNHVHVLIEVLQGTSLSKIVQSWKSYTSKVANKLLGREGRLWQPDYFDRVIRDERHLLAAIRYIHDNPVKAGLVCEAEKWPFSSARRWWGDEAGGPPALPG